MKTKLIIEFRNEDREATISLVDENGNGQIIMTGAVHAGSGNVHQIDQCKGMLREMVANMNAYREANDYDDRGFLCDDLNVGETFRGHDGKRYLCDGYDPQQGYWMTEIGNPDERRNVSERAIGTNFIKIYA